MSGPNVTYDAIIIGGGHNGLVTAAYLARAKQKVLLLEARDVLGGMTSTEEIWPGYHVSRCAHVYPGLHPRIIRDLGLYRHGLRLTQRRMSTTAIGNEGEVLPLSLDKWASRAALAGFSAQDGKAYETYLKDLGALGRFARALSEVPAQNGKWEEEVARLLNGLDAGTAERASAALFSSAADMLNDRFDTDLLRGACALEAGLGGAGPFEEAAIAALALRAAGEVSGVPMALGHPQGGIGTIATALVAAAQNAGAEILLDTKVEKILVHDGVVRGVQTSAGEEWGARATIAALAPAQALTKLVGNEHLEPDLVADLRQRAVNGTVGKLNLALSGVPEFRGLQDQTLLKGRLVIAPSIDHLQHSFAEASVGHLPRDPAFEITIPTTHDASLAPKGHHILCANVMHVPYEPEGGWMRCQDDYRDRLVAALGYYAPGLADLVKHAEFLSPKDIEGQYGAPGGHWHHANLSFDQLASLRPQARARAGDVFLGGLYFASAGAHSGGGISGLPGLLCAEAVLEDVAAS